MAARGVNKAIVIGNVANDPVLKVNTRETYLKLIVLTNGREQNIDTGEWEDCTDKHVCMITGAWAESLNHKILKGQKLYIEGAMKTIGAKNKKCNLKHYFTRINVRKLEFLGAPPKRGDQQNNSPPSNQAPPTAGGGSSDTDDDIPF